MRATMYGAAAGPSIAVAGVWDPLAPSHRELFEQLHCRARRNSLSSLVIVIDPDPARLLQGDAQWPVYNDLQTRVRLLLASGIDGVLHLHFARNDLSFGAREFFSLVTAHVALKEFWLGARQSLGRGPAGSQETIMEITRQYGIPVQHLPRLQPTGAPYDIRKSLAGGRVAEIARLVGHPPMRGRPRSGIVRLAWQPGCYGVQALDSLTMHPTGPRMEAELVPARRGLSTLQWPDRSVKYLAFMKGPADQ
jgi:FAD synthase